MKINDIFSKDISRDYRKVIKIASDYASRQELEEYVVTKELYKHFTKFFENYAKSIDRPTDEMGVWISGFFGSGKSHLLKIIATILANPEIDGKRAIDYFIEDNKIDDAMTIGNMKRAASLSSDVMLFNVESKVEQGGVGSKDSILNVFLKVFNDMQGFCGTVPAVADFERHLTADGRYDEFKSKFNELTGNDWENARYDIDFIQDDVVDVLVGMNYVSEEAARNLCSKFYNPFEISIEGFVKLVQDYLKGKPKEHKLIFLVDEIGQYIGDDGKLMLNLQMLVEELGKKCEGKVWVIVTSQQNIDSVIKVIGDDFSKIQGRFDTRLVLSSSDVGEVIRKRFLEKTPSAEKALSVYYDANATKIKNLVVFNDGIEHKLYKDAANFVIDYPFFPYHYDLASQVLTALRQFGVTGQNVSDGERNLLAVFKESAMAIKDSEIGALVPFNRFYEVIKDSIEQTYVNVINGAVKNEIINPTQDDDCFEANVLKTLFLIKYVKGIKPTVYNITSLMVSSVDEDRMNLTTKVEKALGKLISQTLVQKNGDNYTFLSHEEQEIERFISAQPVETDEIRKYISETVFEAIYSETRYKYPEFNNRYAFGFNQIVDGKLYKAGKTYDISLEIITPDGDERETALMASGQRSSVIVVLPDDRAFINEVVQYLKINKYLLSDAAAISSKYEQIKDSKRSELREHYDNIKLFLTQALKAADIYVNGDKITTASKEIAPRLNEAMGKLVTRVYHKLSYIDTPVYEQDIRELLKESAQQISLSGFDSSPNANAVNDMQSFIAHNTQNHLSTSFKTLLDRFMKAPYGFIEIDVSWILAKLFKSGVVALTVNSESISLVTKDVNEIVKILTNKAYHDKLMANGVNPPPANKVKAVREVAKELFGTTITSDNYDEIMSSFNGYIASTKTEIEKLEVYYSSEPSYPGKSVLENVKTQLVEIAAIKNVNAFYDTVFASKDELLELADDFEPVKKFFKGEQRKIFDDSLKYMRIYNDSKTFVVNAGLEETVKNIKAILCSAKPYSQIFNLPGLNDKFLEIYNGILDDMEKPVLDSIADARASVFEKLNSTSFKDESDKTNLSDSFVARFDEIKDKAQKCNNIATLQNIKVEADALKVRCLNEIDDASGSQDDAGTGSEKKKKNISIKSVVSASSWQIDSEADIDKYIEDLKQKLIASLEDDTTINIQF